MKIPETELAKQVIVWLQEHGWTVYQEVQIYSSSNIADIVATRDSIIRVVECKTTLSSVVIEQAWKWRQYANYTHVAVPSINRYRSGGQVIDILLRHLGVGYLSVSCGNVFEKIQSRLNRKILPRLKNCLREEHKTWAEAGNATGDRFTPWAKTCYEWAQYVAQHEGCTLKQLIDSCNHHYNSDSTAKSSMAKWIELGKVKGIKGERDGKHIKIYTDNAKVIK